MIGMEQEMSNSKATLNSILEKTWSSTQLSFNPNLAGSKDMA